jgi:hypothetical protein
VLKEGSPVALAWRVDYAVSQCQSVLCLLQKSELLKLCRLGGKVEAVGEREGFRCKKGSVAKI